MCFGEHARAGGYTRGKIRTLHETKLERRWRMKAGDESKMEMRFTQRALDSKVVSLLCVRLRMTTVAVLLTLGGRWLSCAFSTPATVRVAAPSVYDASHSRGSVAMAYVGVSRRFCVLQLEPRICWEELLGKGVPPTTTNMFGKNVLPS